MSQSSDVLVLGGGIIGLSTAYFLAREGARVAVADKGDFGQESSWAGAGILTPGDPDQARSPIDLFRARSVAMFPSLSAELRDRTGLDNGYWNCGGLEFLDAGDAVPAGEWHGEGVACEAVDDRRLHELEPGLSPSLRRAFHLPGMAQVRNPRHLKALLAGCGGLGVRLLPGCPAFDFVRQGGRVTAARTAQGDLRAGRFLVAAGAWSDGLLGPLGWRPGVRPVRGQIAMLNTGAPLVRRVLVQGKRYLVPRPDGRVLAGSTEEDVGFDKRTTAAAVAELIEFACSLVPGLAGAHLERCWAGLRPGSPDELPFLGPVPGCDNVFVAAGHFRSGIQLSPATAWVMTELLLGRPAPLPLEAFRLDRITRSSAAAEEAPGRFSPRPAE